VRRAADPRQRGAASVLQTSQPRTIASQVDFFCWSDFTHVWPAGHDGEFGRACSARACG
jgi:hypothetical protein